MVLTLLFAVLGVCIFLFVFWKRMKEDYAGDLIFSTAFTILLLIAVGSLAEHFFLPNMWFWISFGACVLGLTGSIIFFKLKIFETLDALVAGLLPWLAFVFLEQSITSASLFYLIAFLITCFLIASFIVIDRHYKGFAWYKSGRVGFSGLFVLTLLFIIRAVIAIVFPNMVFFFGNIDAIGSGSLAFVTALLIFNLARKTA